MQIDDENRVSDSSISDIAQKSWPGIRVVARLPGSLPDGGTVPLTPVYAYEQTPAALSLSVRAELKPRRHDIDLDGQVAFVIDDVVTADEADAIVAASENFGFREEAPGISTPPGMRMNKTVHWLADDKLLGPIFDRIRELLPSSIDGFELSDRLSHRLNIYRYDEQDQFRRHTDGDWPGYGLDSDRASVQQWQGVHSFLTMLLYLNDRDDGFQGGATRLFSRQGRFQDITPKKGAALFFRHDFSLGSVVHEGLPVSGSVSKYVARINVLRGFR